MNYLKTFLPYLFGNKKGKSLEISLPDFSVTPLTSLSFEELLMFHTLKHTLNSFIDSLDLEALKKNEVFHLFNFLEFLKPEMKKNIQSLFQENWLLFNEAINAHPLTKKELQVLLDTKTDKLTVYALLRKERRERGVIVIKNKNGEFFTRNNGSIWSIPVLGLSRRGLPFQHSNGCTPMGVYTLDSVMPEANKNFEFGLYRRLIVNFIPSSDGEVEILKLLPSSHHKLSWWKQSVVARILGRSLLRIHGTGRVNRNVFSPFYPFVPTSGCLATNESSLFGFKAFHDQRLLLDALMQAQGLAASYENESKIHGLLYVVEFNDNLSAIRL
jgi:hypothetical protein